MTILTFARSSLLLLAVGAVICPAALGASPPSSIGLGGHRLQQVAITVRELPRAIAFYRDTLGLPLMFVTNNMAFFDIDGMRLMVAVDPKRLVSRPTAILYFDVADLDAKVASLAAAGVKLEGAVETVQLTAQGDLKLQQFVDPDGNALAVMGFVAAK